jgi:hypothetical protein
MAVMANVALFGVKGVMSTSSAVSEWTGEDTGGWGGALSDGVVTAATREKDGIGV